MKGIIIFKFTVKETIMIFIYLDNFLINDGIEHMADRL